MHAANLEVVKALQTQEDDRLQKLCAEVWGLQRQLSGLSEVEVLPEEVLTVLRGAMEAIPAIVLAGVPGAGGYDAAYFIIRSPSWEDAKSTVESVLGGGRCLSCEAR